MTEPTNFSEELDFYLYVSSKVQKAFNVSPATVLKDSRCVLPKEWWSVWRCELLFTDPLGQQHVVLFTNAVTCLSFICLGFRDDFAGLVSEFEGAFLNSLQANGLQLPDGVSTQTRLLQGQPRQLIGIMKQLSQFACVLISEDKLSPAKVEQRLLRSHCSILEDKFPGRAYVKQLDANPPFGAEVTLADDVIIPFPGVEL